MCLTNWLTCAQAALQAEHEALLAEKATWIANSANVTEAQAPTGWEEEKTSLSQELEKLKTEGEVCDLFISAFITSLTEYIAHSEKEREITVRQQEVPARAREFTFTIPITNL